MRIVHVLNHIQEIGNGIVNVAIDLACLQAKIGHQVAVISSGGEYETLLNSYGVKHYTLNLNRTPVNIIKAAIRYREIISDFEPDIVHAHMMTGVVLGFMLRIQNRYALVSTVHNEFQPSAILMGLADRVIVVSQAVAESMKRRGIPLSKLRLVSNGILGSPRTLPIQNYLPVALQRPAITTVAGMYKRKGIIELIEAFEKIALDYPKSHLYIVGDGPDKKIFETIAQASVVASRIHFEGFQPQPQRYLLSSDIFVLASYHESFGLAIAEAREANCAIIASNVDGISQTLDSGQAGILVPSKDSDALANALSKLLGDADTLQTWRDRAGSNLEWLSVERVNQETLFVYRELLLHVSENISSIPLSEIESVLPNVDQENHVA